MFDILIANSDSIFEVIAILTVVAPFLYGRKINDKNLLDKFETAKSLINKVNLKEIDFRETINNINNQVDKFQEQMTEQMTEATNALKEFQKDEIYLKMLDGLEHLNELKIILNNKDEIITALKEEIKQIHKKLDKGA